MRFIIDRNLGPSPRLAMSRLSRSRAALASTGSGASPPLPDSAGFTSQSVSGLNMLATKGKRRQKASQPKSWPATTPPDSTVYWPSAPAIDGVQFRMNVESGVEEEHQAESYEPQFHVVAACARPTRLDLRANGLSDSTIALARLTDRDTVPGHSKAMAHFTEPQLDERGNRGGQYLSDQQLP